MPTYSMHSLKGVYLYVKPVYAELRNTLFRYLGQLIAISVSKPQKNMVIASYSFLQVVYFYHAVQYPIQKRETNVLVRPNVIKKVFA